jgi:hypothetical protein
MSNVRRRQYRSPACVKASWSLQRPRLASRALRNHCAGPPVLRQSAHRSFFAQRHMRAQRRAVRPLAGGAPSRKCQANAQRCAGLQGSKVQEAVCRRGCPANAHRLRKLSAAAHVERCASARAAVGMRGFEGALRGLPALSTSVEATVVNVPSPSSACCTCERKTQARRAPRPSSLAVVASGGAVLAQPSRKRGVRAVPLIARLLSSPPSSMSTRVRASRLAGASAPGSHNTSIERTSKSSLRELSAAAHVER